MRLCICENICVRMCVCVGTAPAAFCVYCTYCVGVCMCVNVGSWEKMVTVKSTALRKLVKCDKIKNRTVVRKFVYITYICMMNRNI